MSPAADVALRPLTVAEAHALADGRRLAGWHDDHPTEGDVTLARLWLADPWQPAPQQIVHDGLVVGTIGTKGTMTDGSVEIGFDLVEAERGEGVGTAALLLMLEELTALGVAEVFAETTQDNGASQRLLLRAGFAVVGENAHEILFSRHL
jgi:RimJ/RimL family protein N-acetyltransferase